MDQIKLKGEYIIEELCNNCSKVTTVPNLIVNIGKESIAKIIAGEENTEMFQYFSFGGGVTPPTTSDIKLEDEVGRIEPVSISSTGNIITATAKLEADKLIGFILSEVGIFGLDASETINTGKLLSRAIISPSITKTGTNEVNITYTLSIS